MVGLKDQPVRYDPLTISPYFAFQLYVDLNHGSFENIGGPQIDVSNITVHWLETLLQQVLLWKQEKYNKNQNNSHGTINDEIFLKESINQHDFRDPFSNGTKKRSLVLCLFFFLFFACFFN